MTDLLNASAQAHLLVQALPHMQRYDQQVVVIKYGGHALGSSAAAEDFAEDVVLLEQAGVKPIVCHGGGPQIGSMLDKLGIKSEFRDGLRVTDEKTVEIVEMVLAGSINKQIVSWISAEGGRAVGLVRQGRLARHRQEADPQRHRPRQQDRGDRRSRPRRRAREGRPHRPRRRAQGRADSRCSRRFAPVPAARPIM